MAYEKEYKGLVAKIKNAYLYAQTNSTKNVLEDIFPELKESEDERIRKALIDYFDDANKADENPLQSYGIHTDKVIAWLEKQGEKISDPRYSILDKLIEADDIYQMSVNDAMVEEAKNKAISALARLTISKLLGLEKQDKQKSANKVEPKFKIGDTIIKKHNSNIHDFGSFTITDITGGKYWYNGRKICDITEQDEWELYAPVRQPSTEWSDEDERICNGMIHDVTIDKSMCKYEVSKAICDEQIEWLKQLKYRIGG